MENLNPSVLKAAEAKSHEGMRDKMASTMDTIAPVWDLSSIFKDDSVFSDTLSKTKLSIQSYSEHLKNFEESKQLTDLTSANDIRNQSVPLVYDLYIYAYLKRATEQDNDNIRWQSQETGSLFSMSESLDAIADRYMENLPDNDAASFFELQPNQSHRERIRIRKLYGRKTLTPDIQKVVGTLAPAGPEAWQSIYYRLQKSISLNVEGKKISYHEAMRGLESGSDQTRRFIWESLNSQMNQEKEIMGNALDAIIGWRASILRLQDQDASQEEDVLAESLQVNHIPMDVLKAMVNALKIKIEDIRFYAKSMAAQVDKSKLDPWDFLKGSISDPEKMFDFKDGMDIIRRAFAKIHPQTGVFLDQALENRWIDAKPRADKINGAFTATIEKDGTPRSFVNYKGSIQDIITLAHELGHGFHIWSLRNLPTYESAYSLCFAESIAIFTANQVKAEMVESYPELKPAIVNQTQRFTLNVLLDSMCRFEFEMSLYAKKSLGKVLDVDLIENEYKKSWSNWFGDTFTDAFYLNWLTKHQLFRADTSFYNYPHTFGFLLSYAYQDLISRKDGQDDTFMTLLVESGIRSLGELLGLAGMDITSEEFWIRCIENLKNENYST